MATPKKLLTSLNLSQWGLILCVIPLLVQLGFLYMLNTQLDQAETERAQEAIAKEKKTHLSRILRLIMESAVGGAVYGLSPAEGAVTEIRYKHASEAMPAEFTAMENLSADNPEELKDVKLLQRLSDEIFSKVLTIRRAVNSHNVIKAMKEYRTIKPQMADIDAKIQELVSTQERYEESQTVNWSQRRWLLKELMMLGTFLNVLFSSLLAIYFYRSFTKRISVVVDNSIRLASNMPLNPPVEGTDEIAQLDQGFRAMAVALEEMSQKERAAVENAVDVICSVDERGVLTKVSAASLPVFGYEPDDLMGRNYRFLLLKDDVDATAESFNSLKTGLTSAPFESRVQKKNGDIINILWSAHWSETEKSFFCVAHDITERKIAEDRLREAEARIRLIVQNLPIGLVIVDPAGTVELFNPTIEKMFNLHTDELLEKNLSSLLDKSEIESDQEFVKNLIEKTKNHAVETTGGSRTGRHIPVEVTVNEFETLEGKRHLVLIIDVTERHEVERLKQEFISMVSHELRSPLNSVLGFLEMLPLGIYGELTQKGQDKVGVAERSITRLIKLINDLLDLDRMETAGLSMEFKEVRVQDIIERSIEVVKTLAENAKVAIAVDSDNATIVADGDRLIQVVVNLLSNAIKYSPAETEVRVVGRLSDDWIEVRVIDQGRGIPEKYKSRIFERFQQVSSDDWRQKGGSGLGLPISRAIVVQHGGSIGVDSVDGKGSQFWFRLPLKAPLNKNVNELVPSST